MSITACSFCYIYAFSLLINVVCLQVTVEAVIGRSVVLPCSSTQHDFKLQDISVHWRHNGSKIVYDVIEGSHSEKQDPRYKNRTEMFIAEFPRGNFSLKLNNLTHTDAGKYSCLITHSSEHKIVQLIINDSTAEKESTSTDQGNRGETGPGVVTSSLLWVYIVLPVLFIVLIAGFIIFLLWRKRTASSTLEQRTEMEMT